MSSILSTCQEAAADDDDDDDDARAVVLQAEPQLARG